MSLCYPRRLAGTSLGAGKLARPHTTMACTTEESALPRSVSRYS